MPQDIEGASCTGTWKYNTDQEQVILQFEEAIRGPSVDFVLHFNYTLSQGLSGFYRSTYKGEAAFSRHPHLNPVPSCCAT